MNNAEKFWIDKILSVALDRNDPWVNREYTIRIIEINSEKICFGVNGVHGRLYATKEFLLNYRPMNTVTTETQTISKPIVELHPDHAPMVERQVMVRAWYPFNTGVRVWPTTYLICNQTGHRSKLLYTDNVGKYPHWQWLPAGERFLMVFEALPDECISFDLYEDIPEPGEFHIKNILRNKLEVYDVSMR